VVHKTLVVMAAMVAMVVMVAIEGDGTGDNTFQSWGNTCHKQHGCNQRPWGWSLPLGTHNSLAFWLSFVIQKKM